MKSMETQLQKYDSSKNGNLKNLETNMKVIYNRLIKKITFVNKTKGPKIGFECLICSFVVRKESLSLATMYEHIKTKHQSRVDEEKSKNAFTFTGIFFQMQIFFHEGPFKYYVIKILALLDPNNLVIKTY